MKKLLLLLLCGVSLPLSVFAQVLAEKTAPLLLQRMNAAPEEYQEVIIDLSDQEDTGALLEYFETNKTPLRTRSYEVITRLQAKAAATQPAVIERLKQTDGVDASTIYPVWIVNSIYVKAKAAAITRMAEWPEIGRLSWNAPVEIESFVRKSAAAVSPNGTEPGLRAIKAPFMWNLGYTGYGCKALIIDTGDDGEHPALVTNFWGNYAPKSHAWKGSGYPEDCADHGTHVTGTVVGLDRKTNDTIGVAYNAHWMGGPMQFPVGNATGCEQSFTQTIFANTVTMQWAINPDGDATTIEDQPDVVNCSWRSPEFDCTQSVALLNSVEAAGIGVVWAQGNEGPGSGTVTSGAAMNMSLVNSFAVGAIDGANPAFPIASFSSRGPTPCTGSGSLKIKPEVCAPGVSVRSSVTGGAYEAFDGTSMAAPHAAGAVVLLREAFPDLSGIQIKTALYNSAKDLGTSGEDNAYGMGIIDLQAAYNYLINEGNVPATPVSAERDVVLIDAKVSGVCKGPVGVSVTFENASSENITSLTITYGLENGPQLVHNWTGNLAPNTFTTVTLPNLTGVNPGEYVFVAELSNPNGSPEPRTLNNRFKRFFVMADADYPTATVTPQPVCNGGRVLLEYTGSLTPQEKVQWFINLLGNPISEENTFLTPAITQNTTYYINTAENYFTGKTNLPANSNTGSIDASLEFDVFTPFTLKSVKVYADEASARLIKLLDSDGNQVAFKITAVPAGESRITLNFKVPVGENYRLTVDTGDPLKQTSTQAGYPYEVPNVLKITGGRTSSGFLTTSVYYYFFDWEIEVPRVCGRIPILLQASSQTAPTVSFTASADTVYLSGGGSVSFNDLTAGATSRSWTFGDGQTSTAANPTVVYTQPGNYKVRLQSTDASGCSNFAEKTIVVLQTVSTDAPKDVPALVALFPNPASGQLFLEFGASIPDGLQISVFDMLGRAVLLVNKVNFVGQTAQVDISSLPPGVYTVQASGDEQFNWAGKFVKK